MTVRTMSAASGRDLSPRELVAHAIDAYARALEADPELYRFVTTRMRSDRAETDHALGLSAGGTTSVVRATEDA